MSAELGRGWGWGPFTESLETGFGGRGSGGYWSRPRNYEDFCDDSGDTIPQRESAERASALFALGSGAGTAPDPEAKRSSYKT